MDENIPNLFRLFNEIGIINQLASAILQSHLPKGVLVPHFTVLNHLVRVRDGSTPLELARAFQVPKTTMTHTLSGLKERAWVEERRNPQDARSKQVWLTRTGRHFRDEVILSLGPDLAAIERALPGLAGSLLPDLTRVREYLDSARDCR
ncbi:MAG: winged helix-turn-helix transcriptional regulator [Aestuariivirga sp.]|uniref:MarR family winged helix-turn-helix transcriptional regulator n=1 Tax=Aestuariivirga sp. TaxID=2650926 RepID=UPI0025BA1175|nr:MarR family winged helix-turn-helix transcriptional regulator [Aestuariivirga sp.]MCA3562679.1 winged helix-turn-helix transcriptional regulator [Aestuariivirga sp.]